MENKVMTWLVKPFLVASKFGLGRMLSAGEKLMGGIAKVTGVTALHSFADFLVLMQEVIEGFHRSGEKIVALLHEPSTRFMLVTVPTHAAARSAANIASQLAAMDYRVGLLLLNRCLPAAVAAEVGPASAAPLVPAWDQALARRAAGEKTVRSAILGALAGNVPLTLTLEDQETEVGSVAAVMGLADKLMGTT
jgi:hypothetical protein